jgi:hypothetical protein
LPLADSFFKKMAKWPSPAKRLTKKQKENITDSQGFGIATNISQSNRSGHPIQLPTNRP